MGVEGGPGITGDRLQATNEMGTRISATQAERKTSLSHATRAAFNGLKRSILTHAETTASIGTWGLYLRPYNLLCSCRAKKKTTNPPLYDNDKQVSHSTPIYRIPHQYQVSLSCQFIQSDLRNRTELKQTNK